MLIYKFKAEKAFFLLKLKTDQSNTTNGKSDMALHKMSNHRSYEKIYIMLHHGNLYIMQNCT